LAALASTSACTHWTELRSSDGARVWLISSTGKEVLRCIDATPTETPYRGNLKVFCKEALIYDDTHDPMVDAVDTTPSKIHGAEAPPPRAQ
jgi:hypothetical protein